MEAQRYPDDYDALIAGAPVNNQLRLHAAQMSRQIEMLKDQARVVPPEKIALFANAVLNACDAKDGVKDGIVADPERCVFNPSVLQYQGADGPNCLTAAQVESA